MVARLHQSTTADQNFYVRYLDTPGRFKSWPLALFVNKTRHWSAIQRAICSNRSLLSLFNQFNATMREKVRRDYGFGANVGIPANQTISDFLLRHEALDLANRVAEFRAKSREDAAIIKSLQRQVASKSKQMRIDALACAEAKTKRKYQQRLKKARSDRAALALALRRRQGSLALFKNRAQTYSKRRRNLAAYAATVRAAAAAANPIFYKAFGSMRDSRSIKGFKEKTALAQKIWCSKRGLKFVSMVTRDQEGEVHCFLNVDLEPDAAQISLQAKDDELAQMHIRGQRRIGLTDEEFELNKSAINLALQATRTARARAKKEKIKTMRSIVKENDPESRIAKLREEEAKAAAAAAATARDAAAVDETARLRSVPVAAFSASAVSAMSLIASENDETRRREQFDAFVKASRMDEVDASRLMAAEQEALRAKKLLQCRAALIAADRLGVPKRAYAKLSQLARDDPAVADLWKHDGVGLPPEYDVQQYKSALNKELMEQCPLTPLVEGAHCGWFIHPKHVLNFLYHRFGLDIDNEHLVYRICMDGASCILSIMP